MSGTSPYHCPNPKCNSSDTESFKRAYESGTSYRILSIDDDDEDSNIEFVTQSMVASELASPPPPENNAFMAAIGFGLVLGFMVSLIITSIWFTFFVAPPSDAKVITIIKTMFLNIFPIVKFMAISFLCSGLGIGVLAFFYFYYEYEREKKEYPSKLNKWNRMRICKVCDTAWEI